MNDADFDNAIEAIVDYLYAQQPFPGPSVIHAALNQQMSERFRIAQCPLDKRYQFHSTLFMDNNAARLEQMQTLLQTELRSEPLPHRLF